MGDYIKKIKSHEIEIYEGILLTSLIYTGIYVSSVGMDGLENSVYNIVESILS